MIKKYPKHEPGVPYVEIMPDGSMMEFIDLDEPQLCIIGLSEEQIKEAKEKIKK